MSKNTYSESNAFLRSLGSNADSESETGILIQEQFDDQIRKKFATCVTAD